MTEKEFAAIGREARFLLRGTIRDLAKEDLSHFDDGREFIFLILPVPAALSAAGMGDK